MVGAARSAAVNALGGQSLAVKESRRNAVGRVQDTVLEQSPRAGETVKAGTPVTIVLADATCPATPVNLGNDNVFIYLDLPETKAGGAFSWRGVAVATYKFPRCFRVAISDGFRYSCNLSPTGAAWAQSGNVDRDALCTDSGNPNQALMRTQKK